MELQRIWVTLALKSKEFLNGLDQAQGGANSFSNGITGRVGGALSGLQTVATGAFLGLGAAAIGGFGMALNAAIDMNASLEQSTMQFTTLMGDADMAAEHVANLFEFGAKTPFETGPIIVASKHLQIFGGEALNSMENLTLVGDAAAAVGAPIDEVSFWVGRLYSNLQAGAPFGEAAARLQELGIMGPEVRAQLEGMQESGAGAAEIFGAFQEDMGKFTGAMDLQSSSWSGMMSTLSDSLSMAAAEGLRPFFELARAGLGWLLESGIIDQVGAILSNFFKLIMRAPDEGGPLLDYLQELPLWLQPIGEFLARMAVGVSEFFTALTGGEGPGAAFAVLIENLARGLGMGREEAEGLGLKIGEFFTNLAEFMGPLVDAALNFVSFKDVLIALGVGILSMVIPAIAGLVLSLAPILLAVAAVIGIVALLRTAWESNFAGIQEKTASVIAFVRALIEGFIQAVSAFWNAHGEEIVAVLKQAWDTVKAVVEGVITILAIVIQAFIADVKEFWEMHGEQIVRILKVAWDSIMLIIRTVLTNIKLIVDAFVSLFQGDWEGFKEKIIEAWENAWNAVVTILSDLWALILPELVAIWESIKKWFDEKTEALKEIGRDVIEGILNGLDEKGDQIRETLVDWATKAWDAVKKFFGISSPSEKGKDAGRNIGEGFIEGVQAIGDSFWTETEDVWTGYYADLEAWYLELPWEDLPLYTMETWDSVWETLWDETEPRFEHWYDSLLDWWTSQPWEEMPDHTMVVFATSFGELSGRLQPTFEEFFEETIIVFQQFDWSIIGAQIVSGIVAGVEGNRGELFEAMVQLAREAIAAAEAELRMASPAKALIPVGEAIVLGIAQGVDDTSPALMQRMSSMADGVTETLKRYFKFVRDEGDYLNDWLADLPESIRFVVKDIGQLMADGSSSLRNYFLQVIEDGDYLNDWLTGLPESMRPGVEAMGKLIHDGSQEVRQYFTAVITDGDYLNDWLDQLPADMQPSIQSIGQLMAEGSTALSNYFNSVIETGDYLNDWLTHLPEEMRPSVEAIGAQIAGIADASVDAMAVVVDRSPPLGESIIIGVLEGIERARPALILGLEQLIFDVGVMLEFGSRAESIGSGFAGHFERKVIGPLVDEIGKVDQKLLAVSPIWERVFGHMNARLVDLTDPANMQAGLRQLTQLRNALANQGISGASGLAEVDLAIGSLAERNNLNAEYLRQQERLLALEKARSDLDFLKQQMELLKLIQENGLDASILEGLQLGLEADAGDLMDTMVRVMEGLVRSANHELQISSPSRVAMEIGQQWNAGLAVGLSQTRGVERALENGLAPFKDNRRINGRGTDNSRRTVINGGVTNIFQGRPESALEDMEVLLR